VATTRFPVDARARFEAEPDAAAWLHRLTVIAMDLRDLPALERHGLTPVPPSSLFCCFTQSSSAPFLLNPIQFPFYLLQFSSFFTHASSQVQFPFH
jgi:hypothetical protein